MRIYLGERRFVLARNIAVLMGLINMENQKQIMDGMIDAIKETGDNVYIFTNHTNRQNNKENAQGAFRIMELPDFEYFDGAIVALDTITYAPTASYVMDRLRKSQIPFITLNKQVEGHPCLESSSFEAQYKVVEHLITAHDCKELIYLRGREGNPEADIRYQAFLKVLDDYQLTLKEENLYIGNFTLESGIFAATKIYEKGLQADAIVCANDNMAVGVSEYFKMVGVEIPKDIRLVGFDNSETAIYSNPSVTSIDKNPHQLGYRSIYLMHNIWDGKETEDIHISTEVSCRESCGCGASYQLDVERLKYKYMQLDIYTNHLAEMINGNLSEFSSLQTPEEVATVIANTIPRISLKNFYLCLCDREKVFALPEGNMGADIDLMQVSSDYTEKIEIPLAYENGNIVTYKSFPKGMVLPEEIRNKDEGGSYYVVTPVYFQNCCYGYVVSGNDKLALKTTLYYSWLTNIGVAYENIRKRMLLQDAVIRLNNVWSYDMLTQLYNRAGFYYEAKTILEILKMQNSKIFVLFSDVDGLKKVNDNLGHEAGDLLIKEMAACFKENLTNDMMAMRYGGDEFVVFGSYEDDIEIDYLLESIQASMERRNTTGKNPFQLSASIGVTKYHAVDVKELSEVIDIADTNMYEEKRKKREQKN
ncbi:MAG: GGDEF domain-containing protein [Agathobacter sp.]|nr:GGDEF domain-containing protein [Agathobacter sp.]